uniref:non-specific serine/threonine protein kinase n=1 Tax=Oryzias melastigma TaxID=30732 RepID=A0A3B3DDT5_ORYME
MENHADHFLCSPAAWSPPTAWLHGLIQTPLVPRSCRPLRPVEAVGSGGFGSVFRAEYLGKTVALKRVKKSSKNRLASRQSFWAELNVAHLHHNNIVRVIAASTSAPGGSEPLREERCLRYSADIARGLRYLHAHSLVHLDIKPANVLVSSEEVCKIADFGCSVKLDRARETCADHPHVSLVGGTYTHRAPELLKGEAVSPKADIFSFGITLWQLLTREPPYAGERSRPRTRTGISSMHAPEIKPRFTEWQPYTQPTEPQPLE